MIYESEFNIFYVVFQIFYYFSWRYAENVAAVLVEVAYGGVFYVLYVVAFADITAQGNITGSNHSAGTFPVFFRKH